MIFPISSVRALPERMKTNLVSLPRRTTRPFIMSIRRTSSGKQEQTAANHDAPSIVIVELLDMSQLFHDQSAVIDMAECFRSDGFLRWNSLDKQPQPWLNSRACDRCVK